MNTAMRKRVLRRILLTATFALGLAVASESAQAVVVLPGQSVTINFQGSTGTPPYDFVPLNLMFSAANPFGNNEALSYSTFDGNNALLTSGTFSSGSSIYTSGLGGQLTLNGIVPFSPSSALTTNAFQAVVTATTGSFDLIGATASFQHVLTTGTNQNGIQGTFTAAAVPEQATWLMMLVGFGLLGGALRRQKVPCNRRIALSSKRSASHPGCA